MAPSNVTIVPATPNVVALRIARGYYVLRNGIPIALAFTKDLATAIAAKLTEEDP